MFGWVGFYMSNELGWVENLSTQCWVKKILQLDPYTRYYLSNQWILLIRPTWEWFEHNLKVKKRDTNLLTGGRLIVIFLSNLGKKPPKQHKNLIIEKEKYYQMFSILQFKKLNFLIISSSALYKLLVIRFLILLPHQTWHSPYTCFPRKYVKFHSRFFDDSWTCIWNMWG